MIEPNIRARRIGRERCPIAIIDGFARDPDALRNQALTSVFGPAADHYPGVRAPLPSTYMQAQAELLAKVLAAVFDARGAARVLDAAYSIVSTAREDLSLAQRLPHVDATSSARIALVHYLTPDVTAGTAFFRHRATGYESVDEARAEPYLAILDKEVRSGEVPGASYMAEDTALFERTHLVEAAYNRAVIYRGNMLHSGAIAADTPLSADPATGRLTITGFLALA